MCFLKYTLDIITGTPRVKYIIHIHSFEHSRVIMNMTLCSFHRNINRRENEVQIPN